MRANQKAIAAYGDVKVTTGVASANGVQLIQMLFDGLLESLAAAKGHIQNGAIAEKGKSIARASRIVIGLQGALDFERGGDLANNLNELYGYVTRRLLHVNARNDLEALEEIYGLMNEIRSAWEGVPDLIPATPRAGALLN
ncbi:MAG: flagellar export chaperone FliS [Betaproteobacteria bacterium]|nr:flagellar export chaperone FliS [Betaproteobacteria bacterium]NBY05198.1 flagellar export chaperone FliS [Betaproteobacteria bacterium]